MDKCTFKGPKIRIQMTVWDYKPKERPDFSVRCLPASAHPNTSFLMAGRKLYYGPDFMRAWATVKNSIPFAHLPKQWVKYFEAALDEARKENDGGGIADTTV